MCIASRNSRRGEIYYCQFEIHAASISEYNTLPWILFFIQVVSSNFITSNISIIFGDMKKFCQWKYYSVQKGSYMAVTIFFVSGGVSVISRLLSLF